MGASIEEQQAAINKYFAEAGEGAWDAFIAAIEKSQKEKTIDFSIVPEFPDEPETNDPAADYAVEKYRQTLEFKEELLRAQREKNLIGEQEFQDELSKVQNEKELQRFDKRAKDFENWQQLTSLGTNFVMSLMDLELEKAGENEEKKKEIRKKYADINFAVTVAQIVADTAASIMKGYAQLGPVAGTVSAVLLGATGLIQIGIANAQRNQVKGYAAGGYTDGEQVYVAGEKGTEWIAPSGMLQHPVAGRLISTLEEMRSGRLNPDAVKLFASGGFTAKNISAATPGNFSEGSSTTENSEIKQLLVATQQALNENTKATFLFMQWKPKVYTEMIKKDLDTLDQIERHRGLIILILTSLTIYL